MRINQISTEQKQHEAAFLKSRMEAMGVSQDELADEMGVTQGTISKWCNGTKPINPERLIWLGGRLDFSPVELRPSLSSLASLPLGDSQQEAELNMKMAQFLKLASPEDIRRVSGLLDVFLAEK